MCMYRLLSYARSFTLASALMAALAPAWCGADVQFTKVADTSTAIPAGTWAGQRFAEFTSSGILTPPVINQGHVLFLGKISAGADNGAYTWSGGPLGLLADPSLGFSELRYPSTQGGEYAFSAYERTSIGRLAEGSPPSSINPRISTEPALRPLMAGIPGFSVNERATESFAQTTGSFQLSRPRECRQRLRYQRPLWRRLSTVASAGMPTPSAPVAAGYTFNSLNCNVAGAGDGVFFYGYSKPKIGSTALTGMYLYSGGRLTRIADTNTPAPGGSGHFTSFLNEDIAYDGRTAAFFGADSVHGAGAYLYSSGVLQSLIADGQAAPGGGTFAIPGYFSTSTSVDSGNVALSANLVGGASALYFDFVGSGLHRLLGTGDTLLGRQVQSVEVSNEALSGTQLAFLANFSDGSSGI